MYEHVPVKVKKKNRGSNFPEHWKWLRLIYDLQRLLVWLIYLKMNYTLNLQLPIYVNVFLSAKSITNTTWKAKKITLTTFTSKNWEDNKTKHKLFPRSELRRFWKSHWTCDFVRETKWASS